MRPTAARCVVAGVSVLVLGLLIVPLLCPKIRSTRDEMSPMTATSLALGDALTAKVILNDRGMHTHRMDRERLEREIASVLKQMNERLPHKLVFDECGHLLDGWGNRVRFGRERGMFFPYSPGPNGRDEGGEGDDIR